MRAVLRGQRTPEEHDALLLGLLLPLELVCGLVDRGERGAARQQARAIAGGRTTGTTVGPAVNEVQAAVVAGLAACAAVTGTGS